MSTTCYFVESDYDLTLRLQELFHETVDLQAKLDHSDVENIRLKEERRELNLKLRETHNEISLLVMKMKHLLSDTESAKRPTMQTISAHNRNIH